VATVCRWQKADPAVKEALDQAAREARPGRKDERGQRPAVRWHRDYPLCRARVVGRQKDGGLLLI
jgi:hypothetical protein